MTTREIEQIQSVYSESKNRILLYVEASVSPEQFRALRKLILDELGQSGAEGRLKEIFKRHGQAGDESGKGGGAR